MSKARQLGLIPYIFACAVLFVCLFIVSLIPNQAVRCQQIEVSQIENTSFRMNLDVPEFSDCKDTAFIISSNRYCRISSVQYQDTVLYSADVSAQSRDHHIVISLPSELITNPDAVLQVFYDSNNSVAVPKVHACPLDYLPAYFAVGLDLRLLSSALLVTLAIVLFVIFLIIRVGNSRNRQVLYLGFICLFFSLIFLNTNGHYRIFTNSDYLWNIVYSIVCFLSPIFCLLYLREYESYKNRRYVIDIGIVFNLTFGIGTIIAVAITDLVFDDVRTFLYFFLIPSVIIGAYEIIYNLCKRSISILVSIFIIFLTVLPAGAFLFEQMFAYSFPETNAVLNVDTLSALFLCIAIGFLSIKDIKSVRDAVVTAIKEKEEAQIQLEKAQCAGFASQIQPHFLFNTVCCIQELMRDDPDAAADALNNFSQFLTVSIRVVSENVYSFTEEVEAIKHFAEIERMRFGEKLTCKYDIQADDFSIPPLSVQPFFENAIDHGIRETDDGRGTVTLCSHEEKDCWIIQVIDDGVGFDTDALPDTHKPNRPSSVGVSNSRMRLERVVGGTVEIQSVIGEGTTVTIRVPKN